MRVTQSTGLSYHTASTSISTYSYSESSYLLSWSSWNLFFRRAFGATRYLSNSITNWTVTSGEPTFSRRISTPILACTSLINLVMSFNQLRSEMFATVVGSGTAARSSGNFFFSFTFSHTLKQQVCGSSAQYLLALRLP